MRVKDRQKRANEAFTKPLTTHLTRDKDDFSCREEENTEEVIKTETKQGCLRLRGK